MLGLLQKEARESFYKFLNEHHVTYTKIDKHFYAEEQNIIADAENLKDAVLSESQDLVMAVELLEHIQHFWKVINEIIRICKVGGYIFISVPSFSYPKHEYPIDLWRVGPKTLASFFPNTNFKLIKLETEGLKDLPRRSIILVKKLKPFSQNYGQPTSGETNWETGLTVFS